MPGLIVIESEVEAVAAAESVTFTVKLVVPLAVGFPASTPAAESVIPAGSDVLPDTDQV
jgi:hypothetical protein